jgi:Fibronectin type III domain
MLRKDRLATRCRLAGLSVLVALLAACSGVPVTSSGTNAAAAAEGSAAATTSPTIGTATLSWTAPTDNSNGSPITDLAGYNIYYGTDPSNLTESISVAGASTTTYVVTGLSSGTYYFAVAAYNSEGVDSDLSNIGQKTI